MAPTSLFVEDVVDAALDDVRSMYATWQRELDAASDNAVVSLGSSGERAVVGMRISLGHWLSRIHIAWLFGQLVGSVPIRDAHVGLAVQGGDFYRLAQFVRIPDSESARTLYVVAIGDRSDESLAAIGEAELSFRPERFDEDGYPV